MPIKPKTLLPKSTYSFSRINSYTTRLNASEAQRHWGVLCSNDAGQSKEDKKAQKILAESTHLIDGHYEVGMLWRDDPTSLSLPDNKHVASRGYHLLEKRLKGNTELKELYTETLNGYVDKGFAKKLTYAEANKISPRTWYIPHHGVLNPNKPGKVRVVFDAAATCNGASLNNNLLCSGKKDQHF
jgi:hypothetical protein